MIDSADEIVYALKYRGWECTGRDIAVRMSRAGMIASEERVALVPIPLAAGRLHERGYNQSEVIAAALAARWDKPLAKVLKRVRETPTQTRLTAQQRLRNVADAFAVDVSELVRFSGMRLVLVDDVITTGATLNACAESLHAAGVVAAGFITFGRALDQRDPPAPEDTYGYKSWNQWLRPDWPAGPARREGVGRR
ncbi:MAG: ComF family protein [Gemmatimonadota bacterium]